MKRMPSPGQIVCVFGKKSGAAFTLLELLVTMFIIALLMGMLFPVIFNARQMALKAKANSYALQLVTAVQAFETEYGKYPDLGITDADTFVAADNHRLMNILRARETGPDLQNPRMYKYVEFTDARGLTKPRDGYDAAGNFLDPWGYQYKLKYDTDYDGQVSVYGRDLDLRVVAWGVGRNGVEVPTYAELPGSDDVTSWR